MCIIFRSAHMLDTATCHQATTLNWWLIIGWRVAHMLSIDFIFQPLQLARAVRSALPSTSLAGRNP